jgi:sarcosine oxidase/L-pipecolate oxidase
MKVSKQSTTVAVIGAGIIGSWTALHLAEAGVNTTLFEQFPLPHTRGSSHGLSRAFRFLGELELGRLEYSLDRWQALENATHETMLVKTGLLNFGLSGDPELAKYMAVLSDAGRPFEWLGSVAIKTRFPALNYPEEWGAAWDPNGAILIAHRCLSAVQTRFLALGGRIVTGQVESAQPQAENGVLIALDPISRAGWKG